MSCGNSTRLSPRFCGSCSRALLTLGTTIVVTNAIGRNATRPTRCTDATRTTDESPVLNRAASRLDSRFYAVLLGHIIRPECGLQTDDSDVVLHSNALHVKSAGSDPLLFGEPRHSTRPL